MKFRPISPEDYPAVLALNEASVQFLSPLSLERLAKLHKDSAFHLAAEEDGCVIAFLLAFREGADYDSVNYQWFDQRYSHFLYIDRVVVSPSFQAKGVGSRLYQQLFSYAGSSRIAVVACEFDIEPPNLKSEMFHTKFGFTEVGRQSVAQGKKVVSLQTAAASFPSES